MVVKFILWVSSGVKLKTSGLLNCEQATGILVIEHYEKLCLFSDVPKVFAELADTLRFITLQ